MSYILYQMYNFITYQIENYTWKTKQKELCTHMIGDAYYVLFTARLQRVKHKKILNFDKQ